MTLDGGADGAVTAPLPARPSEGCAGEVSSERTLETVMIEHAGVERSYSLYIPKAGGAGPRPLVVNFHGFRSNPLEQQVLSKMNAKADAEGFIIAYPLGIENVPDPMGRTPTAWNGGTCCAEPADRDDVGFARALVADVGKRTCVDERRVYATGMSNGGFMTHRLACEAADLFAAFAPVSGTMVLDPTTCNPARPVPIVMFHGTEDQSVPYAGHPPTLSAEASFDVYRQKNGCQGEAKVSLAAGGARCETFDACEGGVEVTLCSIEGMAHCWPGNSFCPAGPSTTDVSANDEMWALFERHPLP
jgi:polyhydroxybutyrate depolymerase